MAGRDFVFAYGSLAGIGGTPAELAGWRRVWGVAMDNRLALPGYKRWRDPDGAFPALHVAFVDIERDPGGVVDGVLLEVDAVALAELDRRERNYRRIALPDGAWTYVGSPAGRARLAVGRARGSAAIARAYADLVPATPFDGLPLLELERVEVPARSTAATIPGSS